MTTAGTPPDSPGSVAGAGGLPEPGRSLDRRTGAFPQWRELLVASLPLRPGDTVPDAGCGTGLCAPLLLHRQAGPRRHHRRH